MSVYTLPYLLVINLSPCSSSDPHQPHFNFLIKFTNIILSQDTIAHYRTSLDGLLHSDIPNLLSTHGYNEFSVATPEPILLKFAKTIYESPLILLLCGSASVSAIMGNIDDAVSIAVAVLIVLTGKPFASLHILIVLINSWQWDSSKNEDLKKASKRSTSSFLTTVMFYGKPSPPPAPSPFSFIHPHSERESIHVLANELVPGDIVTFSTGDRIPADIRIVSAVDLEIDESSLTGETNSRRKSVETCRFESSVGEGPLVPGKPVGEPVPLAERVCIAYMGTLVRNGGSFGFVFGVRGWSD